MLGAVETLGLRHLRRLADRGGRIVADVAEVWLWFASCWSRIPTGGCAGFKADLRDTESRAGQL